MKCHAISATNILIGGDFNCTDSAIDKANGSLDKSSKQLFDLKVSLSLQDIWRHYNPGRVEYSYIDPSRRGYNSRIDLWLGSKNIVSSSNLCVLSWSPAPDHRSVVLEIKIKCNLRGKGYWKLNNSVLGEENYKEGIIKLFDDAMETYGDDVPKCLLWEFLKIKIKEFSIMYCTMKSRNNKENIKDLEARLDAIDNLNDSQSCDQYVERKNIKQQLDQLYETKAKGYHVRSRAKWVECGERSTSYFLGLEKARQSANCIDCLKDTDGTEHHDDAGILNVARSFYQDLYKSNASKDDDIDKYFDSLTKEKSFNDTDSSVCEGLVTIQECTVAIDKMKQNKSPGLDGITVEFYQAFWPLLGNFLIGVYNESYQRGSLPESQRMAVLLFIFKKGDEEKIENYRPISLTNVDYRILAFTLAQRMQKIVGTMISHDQSAYIKGRYMGTNIRLVSDIIDYFDMMGDSGFLLMLDFKKAFDSLEWNFLLRSLQYFNFGPSFIKWIETIYWKPEAFIKNNGHISDTFKIFRGIRQGCPVSAILFILCVEVLGIKIRSSHV